MEIKQRKQVTTISSVVVGYKCDNCKVVINEIALPDEWHEFISQHFDWGNDSHESLRVYHVCSPQCYIEKLIYVVEEKMKDVRSGEVDDIDIQFARNLVEYIKNK